MSELLAETALRHAGLAVVVAAMAAWTWNIVHAARRERRRAAILRRVGESG